MDKIRIGIVGYGNLGRGAELALTQNPDMELVGIFSRRGAAAAGAGGSQARFFGMESLEDFRGAIDVLLLCGGSKADLPEQGPALAAQFNTVDSFDNHARIPEYFEQVDAAAREAGTTAIISVGWDPGLFSLVRLLGEAVLPQGQTATFWGKGVSQGHSDALRRVAGVRDAVQYTIPVEAAMAQVRAGGGADLTTRDRHRRECFVVLEPGADADRVTREILAMPYYFADYETTVRFVSAEELARDHDAMPHGGTVIRRGQSGRGRSQNLEFSLQLESNPEFTASVLVAYGRAAWRLAQLGQTGAKTVLDVAPRLLSPRPAAQLRETLL